MIFFLNLCFRYKLRVAEAVIEHLNPIRKTIEGFLADPDYLWTVLEEGNRIAASQAEKTMQEVKTKIGLASVLSAHECKQKIEQS
jgi:hypothetical protein